MKLRAICVTALAGAYVAEVAHLAQRGEWIAKIRAAMVTRNVVVVVGGAGLPEMVGDKRLHWPAERITIFIDSSIDQLGRDAHDSVMDAAGAWLGSGAALPDVSFGARSGGHPGAGRDGTSGVYAAPLTTAGHEGDAGITIARVDRDTGEIIQADIILNSAYRWGRLNGPGPGPGPGIGAKPGTAPDDSPIKGCMGTYDVESAATHEFGHFFGIVDNPGSKHAAMFPEPRVCTVTGRDLKSDDKAAMMKAYPPVAPR